jgi:hypothetical protein
VTRHSALQQAADSADVIPGSARGGVLCLNHGIMVGGSNIAFFRGIATKADGEITGTVQASRFNDDAQLDSLWSGSPRDFTMTFRGRQEGDTIAGRFERLDRPERSFDVVMTYRGSAP